MWFKVCNLYFVMLICNRSFLCTQPAGWVGVGHYRLARASGSEPNKVSRKHISPKTSWTSLLQNEQRQSETHTKGHQSMHTLMHSSYISSSSLHKHTHTNTTVKPQPPLPKQLHLLILLSLKPSEAVRKTLMPKGSNAYREQEVCYHLNTTTTHTHTLGTIKRNIKSTRRLTRGHERPNISLLSTQETFRSNLVTAAEPF